MQDATTQQYSLWQNSALKLYEQGLNDREIADKCAVSRKTISNFRKAHKLPSHTSQRTENWRKKCQELYRAGLNDTQISIECNVSPRAITYWRKQNNLQSNTRKESDSWHEKAFIMYKNGALDAKIAESVGVNTSAVGAWRARNSLPSNDRRFRVRCTWHNLAKELHDSGEPDKNISAQCNVPIGTVKSWRKKHGYSANAPAPARREPPWHDIALRLYNDGCSRKEIAEICNVTPDAITYWRSENKLPRFNNPGGSTHGAYKRHSGLSVVWRNMLKRCEDPANEKYRIYGKRGISVCEEWHDPNKFIDWALANGYQRDLQIDRIDNDGNYEPSNCRWVTRKENGRNRRDNKIIAVDGVTKCVAEWAEIANMSARTIYTWLSTRGQQYAEIQLSQRLKGE